MLVASLVTVCICIFASCLLLWKRNSKWRNMINRFPGPKTVPIFGNILQMMGGGSGMYSTVLKLAVECYGEEGVYRLWFANKAVIVAFKAEHLEVLLSCSKNTKKSIFYNMSRPWLQDGLLLSHGPKWQRRRKQLTPTFHYSILESFIPIFDTKSCILVDILDKKVDGESFDIYSLITNCTLDIICETAMGIDIKAQENGNTDYIGAVHRISDIVMGRMTSFWNFNDTLFSFTALAREHQQVLDVLHSFTKKVIEERWTEFHQLKEGQPRAQPSMTDSMREKIFPVGNKLKHPAFLDLLLAGNAENVLTVNELQEEVDTFMFEGHDTTAVALTWTLYLLAVNKESQLKVREEINATFESERPIEMAKLKNLKYLEYCIKESMRLFPPVPFFGREITHECKIGGNDVPVGTTIFVLPAVTQRDPRYFPSPEEFLPDRWSTEDTSSRHPFSYVPFSAGPRNCIGQKFAMLEEKIVLSNILRKFEISCDQSVGEVDPQGLLVLRPAVGVFIKLRRVAKNM